jgi:hypothetical protein
MRYFWFEGQWVPGWVIRAETAPHTLPVANIIGDEMEPLEHPLTGETLDSKSQFRRRTHAAGCEELGNDAPRTMPKRERDMSRRDDIQRAWQKLEQGYRPDNALGKPVEIEGNVRMYGGRR